MRKLLLALLLTAGCGGSSKGPDIIASPSIQFVVWGQQDPDAMARDWRTLCASGVFDRLAEYGVTGCAVMPPIAAMPDLQPAEFDDVWLAATLSKQILPIDGVAYVLVLPPGSSTTYERIQGFSAYHFFIPFIFAVAPPVERLVSHELYEIATNPRADGITVGGKEIGDLCEGQTDSIAGIDVQKVWSVRSGTCL